MKQLVDLEMKKMKMNTIIRFGGITCGVFFIYILIYGVLLKQMAREEVKFFNQVIAYNKFVFTIYIAILIQKMFSEEIYSKSLSISFTYPISRSKLLLAKIVLIIIIGLPFMFGSTLIDIILLGLVNMSFHFLNGNAGLSGMLALLLSALIQCVLGVAAAFIPLYADVKYASTQITLVTAGVVGFFLYSLIGKSVFGIEWVFFVVAAAVGIYLMKQSIAYVVEKDVM